MRNEWRRTGSRRSEQVLPPRSWSLHLLVSSLQENERVAPGENKNRSRRRRAGQLPARRAAREIDMLGACDLHGLGSGDCLLGIDLVGGAQAGQRCGRTPCRQRRRGGWVGKPSLSIASMPPVSKKLLAKVARAVKSAGVPRLARKTRGRVPLSFEIWSERLRRRSNGSARRFASSASNVTPASVSPACLTGFHVLDRDVRLVQIGKLAGAGQHVLACGDIGLARLARGRDPCSESGPAAAPRMRRHIFDLLEQRPCGFAKLLRQLSIPPEPAAGSDDFARLDSSSKGAARCAPRGARRRPVIPAPACAAAR